MALAFTEPLQCTSATACLRQHSPKPRHLLKIPTFGTFHKVKKHHSKYVKSTNFFSNHRFVYSLQPPSLILGHLLSDNKKTCKITFTTTITSANTNKNNKGFSHAKENQTTYSYSRKRNITTSSTNIGNHSRLTTKTTSSTITTNNNIGFNANLIITITTTNATSQSSYKLTMIYQKER